ncbi:MAG: hypothetical protein HY898_29860 [Deltaproteobacteria bacterium]|nr:hypothetical protein [Deltaproteobacteria bacterium]
MVALASGWTRAFRFFVGAATVVAAAGLGCGGEGGTNSANPTDRCAEIVAQMAKCYPDLPAQGTCTAETIERFDSFNVSTLSCTALDDMGKADTFAYGGCGQNEHVCGWIFCCADYKITRSPAASDWDIVQLVDTYQQQMPSEVAQEQKAATDADLSSGVSWTWEQSIVPSPGGSSVPMAVELSERVIDLPYATFVARLPAEQWGTRLGYYIGGEVRVNQQDAQGRAIRQVERMVLSPLPCGADLRLGNNDMTKAEVIVYGADRAKVYWRVYFSDNDSTESDVGSVEFQSYDADRTLVRFHSAHRLNAPLGVHISNDIVQVVLQTYFLDHIDHYAKIVLK